MGQIFQGDIAYVLSQGEYSQGDQVLISYDDLHNLVEDEKKPCPCCNYPDCGHDHTDNSPKDLEDDPGLKLFGITPEMVVDFTVWATFTFVIAAIVNWSLTTHSWPWLNVVILSLVSGYGYYKGRNKNSQENLT